MSWNTDDSGSHLRVGHLFFRMEEATEDASWARTTFDRKLAELVSFGWRILSVRDFDGIRKVEGAPQQKVYSRIVEGFRSEKPDARGEQLCRWADRKRGVLQNGAE
jgi:hypothetical protein